MCNREFYDAKVKKAFEAKCIASREANDLFGYICCGTNKYEDTDEGFEERRNDTRILSKLREVCRQLKNEFHMANIERFEYQIEELKKKMENQFFLFRNDEPYKRGIKDLEYCIAIEKTSISNY
jgi:hypothetical protein